MWRMLPVQDPEHLLVAARQQGTDIGGGFNYADYKILRDADTMARSAGYATASVNVSVDGRPEASIAGSARLGRLLLAPRREPGHRPRDWSRRRSRAERASRRDAQSRLLGAQVRAGSVRSRTDDSSLGQAFHDRRRDAAGVLRRRGRDGAGHLRTSHDATHRHAGVREPAGEPDRQRTWVKVIARTKPGFTPDQAAAAMDAALQSGQDPRRSAPKTAGEPGPPPVRLVLVSGHLAIGPPPPVLPAVVRPARHGRASSS